MSNGTKGAISIMLLCACFILIPNLSYGVSTMSLKVMVDWDSFSMSGIAIDVNPFWETENTFEHSLFLKSLGGGDYQSGYTENGLGTAFTALESGVLIVSFDLWMDNSMTTGNDDDDYSQWESFNFLEFNGDAESHAIDVGSIHGPNQSYESGLVLQNIKAEGFFTEGEPGSWNLVSILQGDTVSYAPVPLPATLPLLGAGLLALAGLRRKIKK